MTGDRDARLRRAIPFATGILVALDRVTPMFDPDAFWHLHTGRFIVTHRAVPTVDTFSHTAAGRRWDFVDWLGDIALYAVHAAGGIPALVVFTALLGGLAVAITSYRVLRRAALGPALAVLPLIAASGLFRVTPRPQTFTFALFSATLLLLELPRGIWIVPLLLALWQNIHSSAPLGLAVLGAHALGRLVSVRRGRSPLDLRNTLGPLALGTLALFASVHPLDRLRAGFGHMVDPSLTAMIVEWQPVWRVPWTGSPVLALGGLLVLAAVAIASESGRKQLDTGTVLAAIGTTVLALRAMRFVPLGAIALAPLAAAGAAVVFARSRILVQVFPLLGLVAIARAQKPFGTGLAPGMFPEGAARWVRAHHPHGRLFNDFDDGGYLMFTLGPEHPVFSDGRSWALYDPAFLRDALQPTPARFDVLIPRYDCGLAIVNTDARIDRIQRRPGWSLHYLDDRAFVAARDDLNPALASTAYRVLRPAHWSDDLARWHADPALGAIALDESARAVSEAPHASIAWVLRAAAATANGLDAEADAAAARALRIRPDGIPAHRAVLLRCTVRGDRTCACDHAAWVLRRAPVNLFAGEASQRFGCAD